MFFFNRAMVPDPETQALVSRLSSHARTLYETRQLLCAEAVLVSLNQGLDGGLTENQAVAMAAPFCAAMGESGCICGALSGAVLAAGLIMGKDSPHSRRKAMRESGLALHNAFKAANGATCCRILTKGVRQDKKARFRQCGDLTAGAAQMAATFILEKRPELVQKALNRPLPIRRGKVGQMMAALFQRLS